MPHAQGRAAHAGLSYGKLTARILASPFWQEVMRPLLDELQERRGPRTLYSAHELESVLLFQRVAGERGYKAARGLLAGDAHGDARRLLGLDHARGRATRGNPERWLRRGIPSEATVCRYRVRFEEEREAAYEQMVERLRVEVAPLLENSGRLLYMDGTKIETHYTCPKLDRRTKRVVNADKITCPDGGYAAGDHADKHGHGFNLVMLTSENGLPLAHRLVPLNESEKGTAVEVLADYARVIKPLLPEVETRVVSADGGFHSPHVREAAREAGLVENIHQVSHGDQPRSEANRRDKDKQMFLIEGYPNWRANGHRELFCVCGEGRTTRRAWTDHEGRAHIRTEGACRECGSVSVTSGGWREAQNPSRFVRRIPGELPALQFGNPLTYNDPVAAIYGSRRHGHNEGLHGLMTTRFEHLKGKRWFRRKRQAALDTSVVITIMLSLGLEELSRSPAPVVPLHSRRGEARSGSPPGLAEAA